MSPLTCSRAVSFSVPGDIITEEPVAEGFAFLVELSHGYRPERKGGCLCGEISPCLLACMVKKRRTPFIPQPEDFKSAKINSMTKPCLCRWHEAVGTPT